MKQIVFSLILILAAVMMLTGCEDPVLYPRPKGYPRIELPQQHSYQNFDIETCPFSFEYPDYGEVIKDAKDSCITDFYFPQYQFHWHLTYRYIPGSGKTRMDHENEYRNLVMKHIKKVNHMNEVQLESESGYGVLYQLYGNVGAPAQLIFGDSTHLIMTSFYFQEAVNQDSLKPLIDFVTEDMLHMVESVNWK